MKIRLFQNFSKRAEETLQPAGTYIEKDVDLKQVTSIESPVFIISGFDVTCNYVYIPSWNRYYFVSDWKKGNNDMFEVDLEIDPLATYKTEIGNYTGFVERTSDSSKYDIELYDHAISSKEKVSQVTSSSAMVFTGGATVFCRTMSMENGITTYFGDLADFIDLFDPGFNPTPGGVSDAIENLVEFMVCNPPNFILDTYILPIGMGTLLAQSGKVSQKALASGWYNAGGLQWAWSSDDPTFGGTISLSMPTCPYSDFRKSAGAFSQYSIYFPGCGEFNLSGDLVDKSLTVDWLVDVVTGEIVYNLNADAHIIATYHGNIKSSLQLGSVVPSASALAGAGAGIAVGVATGNVLAIGTTAISATQNMVQTQPSLTGPQGSCVGVKLEDHIVITGEYKNSANIPVNVVGRPCCKNLQISSIASGSFIKCAGAKVPMAGTSREKSMVNDALNGGFYYT